MYTLTCVFVELLNNIYEGENRGGRRAARRSNIESKRKNEEVLFVKHRM